VGGEALKVGVVVQDRRSVVLGDRRDQVIDGGNAEMLVQVTITSRGRPVAELIPIRTRRRRPISRAELVRRLGVAQADPGFRDELASLAGDTTDDLGAIR
jgi:hypothetical protein